MFFVWVSLNGFTFKLFNPNIASFAVLLKSANKKVIGINFSDINMCTYNFIYIIHDIISADQQSNLHRDFDLVCSYVLIFRPKTCPSITILSLGKIRSYNKGRVAQQNLSLLNLV